MNTPPPPQLAQQATACLRQSVLQANCLFQAVAAVTATASASATASSAASLSSSSAATAEQQHLQQCKSQYVETERALHHLLHQLYPDNPAYVSSSSPSAAAAAAATTASSTKSSKAKVAASAGQGQQRHRCDTPSQQKPATAVQVARRRELQQHCQQNNARLRQLSNRLHDLQRDILLTEPPSSSGSSSSSNSDESGGS
jgi:hypothetical protein